MAAIREGWPFIDAKVFGSINEDAEDDCVIKCCWATALCAELQDETRGSVVES